MKVAILTTANQWFVPYAKALNDDIKAHFTDKVSECALFFEHTQVKGFDIVFVLSYHSIIRPLSAPKRPYSRATRVKFTARQRLVAAFLAGFGGQR